jgi:hypothetical protein
MQHEVWAEVGQAPSVRAGARGLWRRLGIMAVGLPGRLLGEDSQIDGLVAGDFLNRRRCSPELVPACIFYF